MVWVKNSRRGSRSSMVDETYMDCSAKECFHSKIPRYFPCYATCMWFRRLLNIGRLSYQNKWTRRHLFTSCSFLLLGLGMTACFHIGSTCWWPPSLLAFFSPFSKMSSRRFSSSTLPYTTLSVITHVIFVEHLVLFISADTLSSTFTVSVTRCWRLYGFFEDVIFLYGERL